MPNTIKRFRIASYNVENMNKLFNKKTGFSADAKQKNTALSSTMHNMKADIAGIIESDYKLENLELFVKQSQLSKLNYHIAKSPVDRGKQDLVFFYRDPFEVISIDENISFYNDWYEDIDADGIIEKLGFQRKPLEVLFRNKDNGTEFLIILVSFKSKGVFSAVDLYKYEHLALANRKKLFAQSKKVRERVENLMIESPELPFIVMGDINDEIGLDHFQKMLGASAVETIMGNIFRPNRILHNTLWHLIDEKRPDKVWSVDYPEPIVGTDRRHKSLIDHIFVSPSMITENAKMKLVAESGTVFNEKVANDASDHLPVFCEVEFL
jgi:exonuclease III